MISLPPASGFQTHSVVHAVMCVLATLGTTHEDTPSLSFFLCISLSLRQTEGITSWCESRFPQV